MTILSWHSRTLPNQFPISLLLARRRLGVSPPARLPPPLPPWCPPWRFPLVPPNRQQRRTSSPSQQAATKDLFSLPTGSDEGPRLSQDHDAPWAEGSGKHPETCRVLCDAGTVEVASPLAASVEDAMLVYSAIAGCRPMDRLTRRPSPLCVLDLVSSDNNNILQSVKLGKYTEWFHDVSDSEISNTCEDALNLLCSTFGCQIEEIILPELEEMRTAHVVSIGSEAFCDLKPHYLEGRQTELTLDTRASLALFGSFTSTDYVASQRLRNEKKPSAMFFLWIP